MKNKEQMQQFTPQEDKEQNDNFTCFVNKQGNRRRGICTRIALARIEKGQQF